MKPQKFLLCFERTNARAGYVWSVKIGRTWIPASYVQVSGFTETVWKGSRAKQPRAYLQGCGTIERDAETGAVFIYAQP